MPERIRENTRETAVWEECAVQRPGVQAKPAAKADKGAWEGPPGSRNPNKGPQQSKPLGSVHSAWERAAHSREQRLQGIIGVIERKLHSDALV